MNALDIIRGIVAHKRASGIAPCHALRVEIWQQFAQYGTQAQMDAQLSELCRWSISSHPTINDTAFTEIISKNNQQAQIKPSLL